MRTPEDPAEKLARHVTTTIAVSPKHLSQDTLDILRAHQLIPGAGVPYRTLNPEDDIGAGTHRHVSDDPLLKASPDALISEGTTLQDYTKTPPLADFDEWLIMHPGLCSMEDGYPGTPEDIVALLLFVEDAGADYAWVSGSGGGRFDDWLKVYENDAECEDTYCMEHPEIFESVAKTYAEVEEKLKKRGIQKN